MKLVVGLGNPGREYERTRHNVGFRVIDVLAGRHGIAVNRQRFSGLSGDGTIGGERVVLLKPMTYMNRSGRAVQAAMAFYKLEQADLLVVTDDMALPLGSLRIRPQGSAGGHNGLADIITALGGQGFARLRIGIGQVSGERMVGHVLSAFTAAEEECIGQCIQRAADAVACWITDGVDKTMNTYNRSDGPAGESGGDREG